MFSSPLSLLFPHMRYPYICKRFHSISKEGLQEIAWRQSVLKTCKKVKKRKILQLKLYYLQMFFIIFKVCCVDNSRLFFLVSFKETKFYFFYMYYRHISLKICIKVRNWKIFHIYIFSTLQGCTSEILRVLNSLFLTQNTFYRVFSSVHYK